MQLKFVPLAKSQFVHYNDIWIHCWSNRMDYRVDEKGKVFTERMTKKRVPVTVAVGDLVIRGFVHIKPETRLKDELNEGETFIAITDASVSTRASKNQVYKTTALIVNKAQIVWIFESESE